MENVYDDSGFFEQYKELREQEINANNLIEIPIMKSMFPSLKDKTILDLGCGAGDMDNYFFKNGAKSVLGIDISQNMLNEAKQNVTSKNAEFKLLKMEDISTINQKFDIVYSSLAFHYVEDMDKLLTDIYNLLNDGGILIYSQESPLVTASIFESHNPEKKINVNGKQYFLLSDFGNETVRNNYWNGVPVTKYHRTYATLVNLFIKNKFSIIEIKDSFASEDVVRIYEKYKNQKDRPYFTFFKLQKN
ncbi:MAG: methyltransferase domain-containing protein [Clostridia bacterium]|nr:methyltransferase domain-containing protein [Clostridia bacterium]